MRLSVILLTIVLSGLISGAAFFVFGYPVDTETTNYQAKIKALTNPGQAFLLPVSEANYLPIRDFTVSEPVIDARAAGLYDVKSGRFLYAQNISKRLPIASVTKLMTAIVIVDNLNLEEIYTVAPENINVDGLGADLYKDEQLRGLDLLKIMLIRSSNDAALTFATQAQRRGIDLIDKMNEKAQYLGMANTHFSDSAGLDDNNTFSTVADLVKLVSYASNYDLILKILTTPIANVGSADGRINHNLINTNKLLGHVVDIIVGKTGYTDSALGTMVLEVGLNNNGNRLISVLLGSNDRFGETSKLIEWGKRAYQWE